MHVVGEQAEAGTIPEHDFDEVGTARFMMHHLVRDRAVEQLYHTDNLHKLLVGDRSLAAPLS